MCNLTFGDTQVVSSGRCSVYGVPWFVCRPRSSPPCAGAAKTRDLRVLRMNSDGGQDRSTTMEEKLARWRAQAEQLRMQDKDSAVSRARASSLSRGKEDSEEVEDIVVGDELIGGPEGSARRTVVDRMRSLKISERRAELSADVQRFREEEEMTAEERQARANAVETERLRMKKEIETDAVKWAQKKNAYWKVSLSAGELFVCVYVGV
jgi:hypothetical protein